MAEESSGRWTYSEAIRGLVERVPKWSDIARFGQSTVAKSAYVWIVVVPLAANLFSMLDRYLQVNLFGHPWNLNTRLPFSWQVLFWASLFASSANVIFGWMCPRIIRDYRDFSQFRSSTGSGRSLSNLLRDALSFRPSGYDRGTWAVVAKFLDRFCRRESLARADNNQVVLEQLIENLSREVESSELTFVQTRLPPFFENADVVEQCLPDAFEYVREHAERVRPGARSAASFLYAVATALALYLLYQNTYSVVTYYWGSKPIKQAGVPAARHKILMIDWPAAAIEGEENG
ncbi:MAG: hypothetical protein SH850_27585 [Planctomycetaceae bacterium]|nr:hypothetical protein [Planctomycetaceae bacterium]